MTVQTINIGNVVNDGLGDDLRTAFEKVNANFVELTDSLTVTARNIGGTGAGVFAQKVGAELQFKNLVAGNRINLDSGADGIVISATYPEAIAIFITDDGTATAGQLNDINIQGSDSIKIAASGSTISFDTSTNLTIFDFGYISQTVDNPLQLALAASNIDFGTVTNPGTLNFDLGNF
jgi:hypothetical protein